MASIINSSRWPKVAFGDVIRNVDESIRDPQNSGLERYVGLEHIDPESLHIQRWGLISEGTSFTRRFRKGQVLFGKRRAYQRKVAMAEFDGLCSSDILVFEPKDDRLLPELLPFICQSDGFFEHALDTSAGSLSPRTKFKELARYEFPLPPLDEQRRIAEILWAADVLKQKTEKVNNELKIYRQARVDDFFTDSNSNLKKIKLEKLIVNGSKNGLYKSKEFYGGGVKTVHMGELFAYEVITSEIDMQRIHLNNDEIERFSVYDGDLLFARRSLVKDGAGKCSIVLQTNEPMSFESSIIRIRPEKSQILPLYLFYWFKSTFGLRSIQSIVRGGTGAVVGISSGDLRKIDVPVATIGIQSSLVSIIDEINHLIESNVQQIKKVINLEIHLRKHLLGS